MVLKFNAETPNTLEEANPFIPIKNIYLFNVNNIFTLIYCSLLFLCCSFFCYSSVLIPIYGNYNSYETKKTPDLHLRIKNYRDLINVN